MTKRDATGPRCDHVHWRFGYQVTWTLSKADTSLKRTVALVPKVSALERVDCKTTLLAKVYTSLIYFQPPEISYNLCSVLKSVAKVLGH